MVRIVSNIMGRRFDEPSEARFLRARAAWHWTLRLGESMRLIRFVTSFGSEEASRLRLVAARGLHQREHGLGHEESVPSTAMLDKAVVQ